MFIASCNKTRNNFLCHFALVVVDGNIDILSLVLLLSCRYIMDIIEHEIPDHISIISGNLS